VSAGRGSRPRVVSLVPSATETLLALGADVVACTRFCNQPLPTVGGTKNPDVAAIVALAPDIVVVDTEENRREDAAALEAAGLSVVATSVRSVDDALAVVGLLAVAAGTEVPVVEHLGDVSGERLRAFVPIWRRPWMTVNGSTYGASLLGSIGVDLVTADLATEYPTVDLDDIARLGPDVVLVPSEPYSFGDQHIAELRIAFADSRVVRVDGEDLFWWGTRTPAAQRRLARQLAGDASG
jgi:ABC-type Fe3+-hydroxamate transport system substrate-binding protein